MNLPTKKIIRVHCAAYPGNIHTMQISFFRGAEGPLPFPCNGCDHYGFSAVCADCVSGIQSMFINDPWLDTSKPLTPETPIPKSP